MNKLALELITMGQPIFIVNPGEAHEFTKKNTQVLPGRDVSSLYGKVASYPMSLLIIPNRTTISICLN